MDDHNIRVLFEKFLRNSCTPAEAAEFIRMLQSGKNREYIEQLIGMNLQGDDRTRVADATLARIFSKLNIGDKKKGPKFSSLYVKVAAAMVSFAIITGTYHCLNDNDWDRHVTAVTHDVSPGGNRATLTLEDGKSIDLSSDQDGIIVSEGKISYADGSRLLESSAAINYQLSTPQGGQYQITLSDGTEVWLNALSKLKYPERFADDKRVVELEGEAYFEVSRAAHENTPFLVKTNSQTIEVLGTHFNVNAYPDEHTTNTTLLEGEVRISTSQASTLLKPGQQSQVGTHGIAVADVDVGTAVDWKNGDFVFINEDIKSIMRKIVRWYGVEVVYEDEFSNDRYSAQISRNKNLSEVLRILQLSGGLATKIENKILHISSPKQLLNHN